MQSENTSTSKITSSLNCLSKGSHHLALRRKFEELILRGQHESPSQIEKVIDHLRELVLIHGIPQDTQEEAESIRQNNGCSLRGRIWKIFLRIKELDAKHYVQLSKLGPSSHYTTIVQDRFRVFKTDQDFLYRVSKTELTRVLNCFFLSYGGDKSRITYVQPMSLMAGCFLYEMSELDAFHSFSRFVAYICPTYSFGFEGATAGCNLAMKILKHVDEELFETIFGINTPSNQFQLKLDGRWAMRYINNFLLCFTPLQEAIKLWDFFMAIGFHMCIISFVSLLIMYRADILSLQSSTERMQFLMTTLSQVNINANKIITSSVQIAREIPDDLYESIEKHVYDEETVKKFQIS